MDNQIIIFDTTLRDGEQTPGVNLNMSEKIKLAKQIESLGVDVIEVGFPAASPGDFEAVREVAKVVDCGVAALARCVKSDIDRAWDAIQYSKKPRIHIFIATSDIHMEYKLKKTPEEVLESARTQVAYAKTLCDDIEFSCEDASRSRPEFLYEILEAVIDAGATTVNIPDTVGYAIPNEYGTLIKGIKDNVPNIDKAIISVHCHDDLGLAVANTLAAFQNGARQAEVTVNGIGERAGNCSLEEFIMAVTTRQAQIGLTHNIDTTQIYRTSQRVATITSLPIPPCKAIVGANAFAHESGIHQHGVLANPLTYEIMTPESVGKTESVLVLGKHSGRHAFVDRLVSLGFDLSQDEIDSAFARFKDLADRKKDITNEDLEALVLQKVADVPEYYVLDTFQIQSGNQMQSVASIGLNIEDKNIVEAATGEGPVDAAYNAIIKIIGHDLSLISYDIKAVTSGEDALGEVTVRVQSNGDVYTGKGLAPDIIESSVRAFINAANRMKADHNRITERQKQGA